MGNENYCPDCGAEQKDCVCLFEESAEEFIDGCFHWEYQHEGVSHYGTIFKKVMPDSDS